MTTSWALRLWRRSRRICETSKYGSRSFHPGFAAQCSCSTPQSTSQFLNPTTPDPPTPSTDHRQIGTDLNLFSTSQYSAGSPLLHPDGSHVFLKLQAFLRAQYRAFGFQEVISPIIYKQSLWERSGHWENYKDDMFQVTGRGAAGSDTSQQAGEDEMYGLKPMNCPGHCLLYASQRRSYRDLPIRYADFSPLHRNEVSGALSGLTRVRRFHQDDGHIFCMPHQIGEEIQRTLKFIGLVYKTFDLGPYKLVLSTRPEQSYIGTTEEWDHAESHLREALDQSGRDWEVNQGDGAFYGPKIDIILKDKSGKEHQTATIQLDFQLPQRFGLTYHHHPKPDSASIDHTSSPSTTNRSPVLIHRAILGSLERFMALLIEHYNGHWPFWLSPRQAIILTINDDPSVLAHARAAAAQFSGYKSDPGTEPSRLSRRFYKADLDTRAEPLGVKIKEAKLKRYNFICTVGGKEASERTVSVDTSDLKAEARKDVTRVFGELGDWGSKKLVMSLPQLRDVMRWMEKHYL